MLGSRQALGACTILEAMSEVNEPELESEAEPAPEPEPVIGLIQKVPLPTSLRPTRMKGRRRDLYDIVSKLFGDGDEFSEWLIHERSLSHPTPYDVLSRLLYVQHDIDVSMWTVRKWCDRLGRELTEWVEATKRMPPTVKRRPPYED